MIASLFIYHILSLLHLRPHSSTPIYELKEGWKLPANDPFSISPYSWPMIKEKTWGRLSKDYKNTPAHLNSKIRKQPEIAQTHFIFYKSVVQFGKWIFSVRFLTNQNKNKFSRPENVSRRGRGGGDFCEPGREGVKNLEIWGTPTT